MERFLTLILGILLALVGSYLIQQLLIKPYLIPSPSMAETLQVGDRVMVQRIGVKPTRGQVAVFYAPRGAEKPACGDPLSGVGTGTPCAVSQGGKGDRPYIKRIIGVAGDTISLDHGKLIRNDREVKEPYARPCTDLPICQMPVPVTVPPGMVFMMGDNRGASSDSRVWGPVPEGWIVGRARAVWWPLDRVHGL